MKKMLQYIEYLVSKAIKKMHLRSILKSEVHPTSSVFAGSHLVKVKLGKYSDIGYDCHINHTILGSFCSLGANITIGGASHPVGWVSTSQVFNKQKDSLKKKFSHHYYDPFLTTIIGNDVWIGDNVMIKSGVTIGDGVVIGMGSIVTKDIPPYEIWAGNPAKFIKKRFDDKTILKLSSIKWWEWDDQKIKEYAKYFTNASDFIKNIEP
jgi:acetyltransferase-like isoleucine patch superfamily enzyme